MEVRDIVRLVLLVMWTAFGGYFIVASAELGAKPRRGTGIKLSKRGFRGVGLLFLLLGLSQAVLLATD